MGVRKLIRRIYEWHNLSSNHGGARLMDRSHIYQHYILSILRLHYYYIDNTKKHIKSSASSNEYHHDLNLAIS